jgi:hypothetical protein
MLLEVGEVVVEDRMNDAIGGRRGAVQAADGQRR